MRNFELIRPVIYFNLSNTQSTILNRLIHSQLFQSVSHEVHEDQSDDFTERSMTTVLTT